MYTLTIETVETSTTLKSWFFKATSFTVISPTKVRGKFRIKKDAMWVAEHIPLPKYWYRLYKE